jgi:hypothetical protein
MARAVPLYRTGALPFARPQIGLADTGETVVAFTRYLGAYHWGLQVSLGTPGRGFTSPQSLGEDVTLRGVSADAAGNAVVAWDKAVGQANCNKFGCEPADVQLFVAVRRPGGGFGAPQLAAHETTHSTPPALLAMSRGGRYAVVFACEFDVWCVSAGEPGGVPAAPQRVDAPLRVESAGIDDAGNLTLGGEYRSRAAMVVWHPDGTTAAIETLDPIQGGSFTGVRELRVGAGGEAIAGWAHVGTMNPGTYSSVRPAGGGFGPPILVRADAHPGPPLVGIDGQGRGVAAWGVRSGGRDALFAAGQQTTGGPFDMPAQVSPSDRTFEGGASLAVGPDGSAALAWLDSAGNLQPQHARVAFRRGTAPFGPAVRLSEGDEEAPDQPQVTFDGKGHAALVWTSVTGGEERVLAQGVGGGGATAPATVARAPAPPVRPPLVFPLPRADLPRSQVVRLRAGNIIWPTVTCRAPKGSVCRGVIRVRTRLTRMQRRRYTVGTARFGVLPGMRKSVSVHLFRTARRALRRHRLECTVSTETENPNGGFGSDDRGKLRILRPLATTRL